MKFICLFIWYGIIFHFQICYSYGLTSFHVTETSSESITVAWESVATIVNFSILLNATEVYAGTRDSTSPHQMAGLEPGSPYHLKVEGLHENGTQLVLLDVNQFTSKYCERSV